MNCELCRSETYGWRPNEPVEDFQEMFAHIGSCPECSSVFAGLSRHSLAFLKASYLSSFANADWP
jgi:hypothetical protein